MLRNINVITNNNYFYVGMEAQLSANDRVINQLSLDELKSLPVENFNQRDALIFHMPNHSDEVAFLISVLTFPGEIILVPAEAKTKFNLDFERRRVLSSHADSDSVYPQSLEKPLTAVQFIQYKLTRRERAIMLHTIDGLSPQAISRLLAIAPKTVYTHRRNALRKLGGRNLFQICPVKDHILDLAIFSD